MTTAYSIEQPAVIWTGSTLDGAVMSLWAPRRIHPLFMESSIFRRRIKNERRQRGKITLRPFSHCVQIYRFPSLRSFNAPLKDHRTPQLGVNPPTPPQTARLCRNVPNVARRATMNIRNTLISVETRIWCLPPAAAPPPPHLWSDQKNSHEFKEVQF